MIFAVIIVILLMVIVFLAVLAVMQIKMAGMEVKDFWSFMKANETLNKLYAFSLKYEKLTPQQQMKFLMLLEKYQTHYGKKIMKSIWKY